MKDINIIKSNAELGKIPLDFNGYIVIDCITEDINSRYLILVTQEYPNAIFRVMNNSYVYFEATNNIEVFDDADIVAYRDCVVYAYGDSHVIARDNTTVISRGNSKIELFCTSSCTAYWKSIIKAYDKSIVDSHNMTETYLYDKSTAVTYKGSTVHICGNDVVLTRDNFRE